MDAAGTAIATSAAKTVAAIAVIDDAATSPMQAAALAAPTGRYVYNDTLEPQASGRHKRLGISVSRDRSSSSSDSEERCGELVLYDDGTFSYAYTRRRCDKYYDGTTNRTCNGTYERVVTVDPRTNTPKVCHELANASVLCLWC